LISAAEAAALLGVRKATLYTYASRGMLRSQADPGSHRRRLYRRAEVLGLKVRADARSGHGPVAAGALDWGEPVVDTAITAIGDGHFAYRGRDAVELAVGGATFESVAELLWGAEAGAWPAATVVESPGAPPGEALLCALPRLAVADPARHATTPAGELRRGRCLLGAAVSVLGGPPDGGSLAARLATGLGAEASAAPLLDLALVLCADHELNASTFAARVAASTGAELYACVQAALATWSGPRHGGASDRVEDLLGAIAAPSDAAAEIGRRARLGVDLPGLGQRLYPDGDPRFPPLLAAARAFAPDSPRLATLEVATAVLADAGHPPANLDFGLNAVAAAAELRPGGAAAIFAVGRMAGWIAHVLEQRQDPRLLRPRARYVGP